MSALRQKQTCAVHNACPLYPQSGQLPLLALDEARTLR